MPIEEQLHLTSARAATGLPSITTPKAVQRALNSRGFVVAVGLTVC